MDHLAEELLDAIKRLAIEILLGDDAEDVTFRLNARPSGPPFAHLGAVALMLRSMLKIMAATAVFAGVHSILASRAAKRFASDQFGERNRNGLYRVVYIGQSVVTFGSLLDYIRRQPRNELYRVEGPLALAMRAAQVGALVYATRSANQVGIMKMAGIESLRAWMGDGEVSAEPEAQGPGMEGGALQATGPFQGSLHPLNFSPIPILWLWPRINTSLLAFNIAATVYLYMGSFHEESRLKEAYGEEYERYLKSGVSFYFPVGRTIEGPEVLGSVE